MWSGIWGLLAALPELLTLLNSFGVWFTKISGDNPAAFAKSASAAFDQLASATTQEEHANAAKNIASLISGLPSK